MKEEYKEKRERMVESLSERGYIESEPVKRAMKKVQRHNFVPSNIKDRAYIDSPQPIGEGQTISAPHMVAMMVENLDVREGHIILEVGGGLGYHAAVLAELVKDEGKIYSLEYIENLARSAQRRMKESGYENVRIIHGDGSSGYEEKAPYDRISVACGVPELPSPLIDQLKVGGKILIPVGSKVFQDLVMVRKKGKNEIKKKNLGGVRFVPLRGEYGF
ncbi:MAG: protein-L-isoaspartate(D-aspartate) O-methyltransferase [Candidatus Thermoplasmatota archaeon]|nr:protein-L-isoaspartate(D-aspartate) O-methyltransferase [Candidatus Thermoplasmatota archaeon]